MRAAFVVAVVLLAGCVEGAEDTDPTPPAEDPPGSDAALSIVSSAFEPGEEIPTRHSCDDANVSPPLAFRNVTAHADSLALIMEDPDAPSGTVLHWTFWNVAANQTDLPEDVDIGALGGDEGQEYRGPCPPDGEHRYFFYAYAVNGTLDLDSGASVDELRAALDGQAIDEAEMYGTYCRPQAPAVGCLVDLQ